jgi:hypothetical protein
VKQHAGTFAHLKTADVLPSAKVSFLVSITNKTFRFAVVDDQITMVEGAFMVYSDRRPKAEVGSVLHFARARPGRSLVMCRLLCTCFRRLFLRLHVPLLFPAPSPAMPDPLPAMP